NLGRINEFCPKCRFVRPILPKTTIKPANRCFPRILPIFAQPPSSSNADSQVRNFEAAQAIHRSTFELRRIREDGQKLLECFWLFRLCRFIRLILSRRRIKRTRTAATKYAVPSDLSSRSPEESPAVIEDNAPANSETDTANGIWA